MQVRQKITTGLRGVTSSTVLLESCPTQDFSTSILAYASESRINVCKLELTGKSSDSAIQTPINVGPVANISHPSRPLCLSWVALSSTERSLAFSTGDHGGMVRFFCRTSPQASFVERELSGHKGAINSISANVGEEGLIYIASGSDDLSCKIWDVERGLEISCFRLNNPISSVKFNPSSRTELLVVDQRGIIRFYDIRTDKVTSHISLPSLGGPVPVRDCDWCFADPNRICAVAGERWYLLNRNEYLNERYEIAHSMGALGIRWSYESRDLFATKSVNEFAVWDAAGASPPQRSSLKSMIGGFSWLSGTLKDYLAIGGDGEILLFKV